LVEPDAFGARLGIRLLALAVVLHQAQPLGVHVIEAADVDGHRGRAAGAGSPRERFDAAYAAEKMMDVLLVELIVGQDVLARLQLELLGGCEREQCPRAPAHRAIATNDGLGEIHADLVSNSPALTSARVGL